MNYSSISKDLEVVSALRKLFIVKKQPQTSTPQKENSNNRPIGRKYQIITPTLNQSNSSSNGKDNQNKGRLSSYSKEKKNLFMMNSSNCSNRTPNAYYPLTTDSNLNKTSEKNIGESESDILINDNNKSIPNYYYYQRNINKSCIQPQNKYLTIPRLADSSYYANPNQNQTYNHNQIYHRRKSTDSFTPTKRNSNYIKLTNPDDIIILDTKLNTLLSIILKGKNASIPCCDWYSYYLNSSLLQHQEDFFDRVSSKIIIRSASNLLLLVIILSYDISFEYNLYNQLNMIFKTIYILLQFNFVLIGKHVMSQLNQYNNGSNTLIRKFTHVLNQRINGESGKEMSEVDICNIIRHHCTSIVDLVKLILNNIQQTNETYKELLFNFYNLSQIETNDLRDFFLKRIVREDIQSMRSIIIQPNYFKCVINTSMMKIPEPYLPMAINGNVKQKKKYTLCLSLDEVLISFSFNNKNDEGVLYSRPGLSNFLTKVSQLYELVLFTSATRVYSEPIVKVIEKSAKVFDHILYREHCSLIEDEYIKELNKLGREMSKVVIIDTNYQSIKFNKDNGIIIQSFYNNDANDDILDKLLFILIKINRDTSETDIRKLLIKYHNEITQKVSASFTCNLEDDNNTDYIFIQHEDNAK